MSKTKLQTIKVVHSPEKEVEPKEKYSLISFANDVIKLVNSCPNDKDLGAAVRSLL